jgi:hypothetical protein
MIKSYSKISECYKIIKHYYKILINVKNNEDTININIQSIAKIIHSITSESSTTLTENINIIIDDLSFSSESKLPII